VKSPISAETQNAFPLLQNAIDQTAKLLMAGFKIEMEAINSSRTVILGMA
jgi:hypothetical protein